MRKTMALVPESNPSSAACSAVAIDAFTLPGCKSSLRAEDIYILLMASNPTLLDSCEWTLPISNSSSALAAGLTISICPVEHGLKVYVDNVPRLHVSPRRIEILSGTTTEMDKLLAHIIPVTLRNGCEVIGSSSIEDLSIAVSETDSDCCDVSITHRKPPFDPIVEIAEDGTVLIGSAEDIIRCAALLTPRIFSTLEQLAASPSMLEFEQFSHHEQRYPWTEDRVLNANVHFFAGERGPDQAVGVIEIFVIKEDAYSRLIHFKITYPASPDSDSLGESFEAAAANSEEVISGIEAWLETARAALENHPGWSESPQKLDGMRRISFSLNVRL